MTGLLAFVVLVAVLYAAYKATPYFSKPWRPKVTHGSAFASPRSYGQPTKPGTVNVVLQRRMTSDTGYNNKNVIVIAKDIAVDDEAFHDKVREAMRDAKLKADTMRKAAKGKNAS